MSGLMQQAVARDVSDRANCLMPPNSRCVAAFLGAQDNGREYTARQELPAEVGELPPHMLAAGMALLLCSAIYLIRRTLAARPLGAAWRRAAATLRLLPAARLRAWPLLLVLLWTQLPAMLAAVTPRTAPSGELPSWWQLLLVPLATNAIFMTALWSALRVSGLGWDALRARQAPGGGRQALAGGVDGWLMMHAPVWLCAVLSMWLLESVGWPAARQEALQLLTDGRLPLTARIWLAFVATLVSPVVEECVFRGALLPAVAQGGSAWRGLLLTSLLFAAIHLNAVAFLPLLVLSLACGLGYMATGNLLTPIVMHGLFNLVSLAANAAGAG
jgi:membrane protease YdiL (CAAX protease family)